MNGQAENEGAESARARISVWVLGVILIIAAAALLTLRFLPGAIGSDGGRTDTLTAEEKSRILSDLSAETAPASDPNTDAKLRFLQDLQQEGSPPAPTNNSSAIQGGSAGTGSDTGASDAEKLRILQSL